ncbi:hypothetical protein ACHAXS_011897 [Conticribra weissflogii]
MKYEHYVLSVNTEEQKFKECPPGMTDAEEDDVERQYHKTAVEVLHEIVFNGEDVDSCLFWKQYEKRSVSVAIYVYDNMIVGHYEAIVDLRKNGFLVEVEDDLRDYLYYAIQFNYDRTKAWFGQPHLWRIWKGSLGKCPLHEKN